jgi:carbon-monoxide dehydrogenase medium subunit
VSTLPDFAHHRPADLDEAVSLVSGDDLPYAGGTELLLAMRSGLLRPASLVDLKGVPELDRISMQDDRLAVGGGTSHQSVAGSALVTEAVPVLAAVARRVGNPRVRSVGTIGGNLCFAEPRSDVATVLIALGAGVRLRSARGEREVPVADFVVGPYTTLREDDEILTDVLVPTGRTVVYEQFKSSERPTLGVAAAREEDGSVLVVVGAVGGVAEVFDQTSTGLDPAGIARSVEVIPDLGGSERYKRHLTELYVRRALERLGATA